MASHPVWRMREDERGKRRRRKVDGATPVWRQITWIVRESSLSEPAKAIGHPHHLVRRSALGLKQCRVSHPTS